MSRGKALQLRGWTELVASEQCLTQFSDSVHNSFGKKAKNLGKEAGTGRWISWNLLASNESLFSVLAPRAPEGRSARQDALFDGFSAGGAFLLLSAVNR